VGALTKIEVNSCGQAKALPGKLLLSNPLSKKVHLFKVNDKGISAFEEYKLRNTPLGVELTERYLVFGDNRGELSLHFKGRDESIELKLSDFPISEIVALPNGRLLVEENRFVNVLKLRNEEELRTIYKFGNMTEPIARFRPLTCVDLALASGKSILLYDL
jgi:hypothetical protein